MFVIVHPPDTRYMGLVLLVAGCMMIIGQYLIRLLEMLDMEREAKGNRGLAWAALILCLMVTALLAGCAKEEQRDCWKPDDQATDGSGFTWSLETNDTVDSLYRSNPDGICIQEIKWVYCQGFESGQYPGAGMTCWDKEGGEVDMRGPRPGEVVDTFICMAGCDFAWGGVYMCPLNSCESWAAQWGNLDLVPGGCTKRSRWALWLDHLSPASLNFRCRVALDDGYNYQDYEGKTEPCIDQEYCYNGCDESSQDLCDKTRGQHP